MRVEEVQEQAMATLSRHGELGQQARQLRSSVLNCRFLADRARIVLHLHGGADDLVLKYETTPSDPDQFTGGIAAHHKAFDLLGPKGVPELLSVDPQTQSIIMRHVAAQTVQARLELAEFGLASAEDTMKRAGGWLRRYHQATAKEGRAIKPDAMLAWGAEMHRSVESRNVDVPRRDLFLNCAEQLDAIAEAERGQFTPIAASHGDLHLRNLLIGQNTEYGIDFLPTNYVPPAHDLSRFLMRYRIWFGGAGDAAPIRSFWDGYGNPADHQAAMRFLLPFRILADWRKIPKKKEDRSTGQQRQFKGLLHLAKEVFDLSGERA